MLGRMEIVILVVVLMLVAAVAVAAGVLDRPRRVARRTRVVERPIRERVVEVERPAREVVERPAREVVVERDRDVP